MRKADVEPFPRFDEDSAMDAGRSSANDKFVRLNSRFLHDPISIPDNELKRLVAPEFDTYDCLAFRFRAKPDRPLVPFAHEYAGVIELLRAQAVPFPLRFDEFAAVREHDSKTRRVAEQVKYFRSRFVQSAGAALGDAIPRQLLMQWVTEECGRWRERLCGPLQTPLLFIEHALGADHRCQDTVARGVSARVARRRAMCSLNSGSYCKARQR